MSPSATDKHGLTILAGGVFSFTVTCKDRFGNAATDSDQTRDAIGLSRAPTSLNFAPAAVAGTEYQVNAYYVAAWISFDLVITIDGVSLLPANLPFIAVNVLPSALSPIRSFINCSAAPMLLLPSPTNAVSDRADAPLTDDSKIVIRAGQLVICVLNVKDAYSNPASTPANAASIRFTDPASSFNCSATGQVDIIRCYLSPTSVRWRMLTVACLVSN